VKRDPWAPPAPPALPPPTVPSRAPGVFWRPSIAFVDELAQALEGQRVLEIFAGNGYLAGQLARRGVDVLATSVLSSMDGHESGLYHPVVDLDAVQAVLEHGDDRDVLLMCWPTTTRRAHQAAQLWEARRSRPIAFIGEYTDYARGHLGGCATDEFFESFLVEREFKSYRGNCMERACMGRVR